MKKFSLALCTLLLATAGLRAQAPQEAVEKILDEGRNRSQVMRHLNHLTNVIGPLLTSSKHCTHIIMQTRSKNTSV